jgi:hypothetical protein
MRVAHLHRQGWIGDSRRMNQDRYRRLRAYFMSANATLKHIPAPVPPEPALGWDAPTFDIREMYVAYHELPGDLQEQATVSHLLCEDALVWQHGASERAFLARSVLAHHVVHGTEIGDHVDRVSTRPAIREYLAQTADREADEGEDEDDDEDILAQVERDVQEYVRALRAERDDGAAASRVETGSSQDAGDAAATAMAPEDAPEFGPVAATAVERPVPRGGARTLRMVRAWAASATATAAICALLMVWQHMATPAVVTVQPINQSIQAGNLTAIVSVAQQSDDATEVYVHVINSGSEPKPAGLSLGDDELDPSTTPMMVPGKSVQHRVLRVRKDRDRTRPVMIHFENVTELELNEL